MASGAQWATARTATANPAVAGRDGVQVRAVRADLLVPVEDGVAGGEGFAPVGVGRPGDDAPAEHRPEDPRVP